MNRRRMEKSSWSLSHLYTRCFLVLASIGLWWMVFVLHFSIVTQPHEDASTVSTSVDTSLIRLPERTKSLRSSLSVTPQKVSVEGTSVEAVSKRLPSSPQPFWRALASINNKSDPCAGRYIYVHDLPVEFNQALLDNCRQLSPWTNMCKYTENAGLGPPLEDEERVFSSRGWFATNQFAVDVIFHNRMKQYECLTNDSGKAAALFVPFFAGLDIARHLWGANISVRDSGPLRLASWLRTRPEWKVMGGRDHFVVGGRITWDFRRLTDDQKDWGNKLLYISEVMNMSMLLVEGSPYHKNDFAIPYPSYFHPTCDSDVLDWQHRAIRANRSALFSFAGAPRPEIPTSIRGQIFEQCKASSFCRLLECDRGESKCHIPGTVTKLFQESVFCLQPQGDSYTRRSIFDSMIAGCIPVFFHRHSAYSQYTWHLPHNYSKYSVFIPEDDVRTRNQSIEEVLRRFSSAQVLDMREEVIRLMPGLVYADPRHRLTKFKDAFDVTVQALIDQVTALRIRVMEGRDDFVVTRGDGDDIRESDLKLSQRVTWHWDGERLDGEHNDSSKAAEFQRSTL